MDCKNNTHYNNSNKIIILTIVCCLCMYVGFKLKIKMNKLYTTKYTKDYLKTSFLFKIKILNVL